MAVLLVLRHVAHKLPRPLLAELFVVELETPLENAAQRSVLELWDTFDPFAPSKHLVAMADARIADEPQWWADRLAAILVREPSNEAASAALEATLVFLSPDAAISTALAVAEHLTGSMELEFRLRTAQSIFGHRPSATVLEQIVGLAGHLPVQFREYRQEGMAQEAGSLLRKIRPHVSAATSAQIDGVLSGLGGAEVAALSTEEYPKDVTTALIMADARYDGITCDGQAVAQARSWPIKDRADVWELLCDLGDLTDRWRNGEVGAIQGELKKLGHGYANDSSKASQERFKKTYNRTDTDGTPITLGPHYKFGSRRLMFAIREDDRRIVIGHAGNHPRTVTSKA